MSANTLLPLAMELQTIAQTGITFSTDDYDQQRYHRLNEMAHEMLSMLTDTPIEAVKQFYWPEKGYPTPKGEVRVAAIEEGRVLLVQEREDLKWALPGGYADQWLTPKENALKELQEETGLTCENMELVAVLDNRRCVHQSTHPAHTYTLLLKASKLSGTIESDIEIVNVDWFPLDQLPELSSHRTIEADIQRVAQFDNVVAVD